jgi:predicted nucleotidyltransferase component of viral defense system
MPPLRKSRNELSALIGVTAEALGIGAVFVEKDFWVTEVLRAATATIELEARDGSHHQVNTIFKGGTSLTRVHGLIERFSEDVDLLIGFPSVDASAGAKDRVLKGIRDAVCSWRWDVAAEPIRRDTSTTCSGY